MQRAARDIYARALLEGERDQARFQDLSIEFVDERDDSLIFALGGQWDRKFKRWTFARPETCIRVKLHVGQIESAHWFRDWFAAYLGGAPLPELVYSVLLYGGSRAGKTHLGLHAMVAFAIAVPGARVWAVQETGPERADELETELDELLPEGWFRKREKKYICANGSVISLRSANHPQKLKRGRCDYAFLNEGQNVSELAFAMLRMRTSDTSGLLCVAANPPNDNPLGEWVADWITEAAAARRPNSRVFYFDPRVNPHVNQEQLAALANETDHRTFQIEVLGLVMPPSNAVYHALNQLENLIPPPRLGDVTEEFCRRRGLGRAITHFVGLDFQLSPHMAAVVGRCYVNAADATKPLLWYVDEVVVDLGDEYDLSDGLYEIGLNPEKTALIGDASGDWQRGDRQKMKEPGQLTTSFQILKQCGWRRVYQPDKSRSSNPPIGERIKNDNRLMCSESGVRRLFIDPDACPRLTEAVKQWRRRNLVPEKRSKFAHLGDSMSYGNWRLAPRAQKKRGLGYKRIKGRERAGAMRGL